MAIICPRCAMPTGPSAEAVGTAGHMRRCTRCNTTWFARVHAADPFMKEGGESPYLAARRSGRPRFERIVEHVGPVVARQDQPVRPPEGGGDAMSRAVRGLRMGRRRIGAWFGAAVAVVVCSFATVLALQSAVVGAAPAVERAQFAGLEIRLISATIEPVHNRNAVIVVGEIANRTDGNLAVPAVRIAVLSGGTERHAWLHQPARTRLAAGEALTFRSFLTSPPAGVDELAFRLADRPNVGAGID